MKRDLNIIKGQLTGLCVFVTSTFGNGEPPGAAVSMAKWIDSLLNNQEDEVYERLRVESIVLENYVEDEKGSNIPGYSRKQ